MRKVLAVLVLMVAVFSAAFADDKVEVIEHRGDTTIISVKLHKDQVYSYEGELFDNVKGMAGDWKWYGWNVEKIEITFTTKAEVLANKGTPESILKAIEENYAYSHYHTDDLVNVERVMAYQLKKDRIMLVTAVASHSK